MLENTLRSLNCPISANHCEVFMQGQIRQERAQLDFYTLKKNNRSLCSKKSKHPTCSWGGGRAEQSGLTAKQINMHVEDQGDKESFLPHSWDVSVLSQPLTAGFCLTGNPGISENPSFNTFLTVWAWSYWQSQTCLCWEITMCINHPWHAAPETRLYFFCR